MLALLLMLAAEPLSGPARVVDGDTIELNGYDVRLFGIDAPERDQVCTRQEKPWSCGREAGDRLAQLVVGRTVTCVPLSTDRFGRTVARCRAGETDLNRVMVASGFAAAFRRYSADYVSAEETARSSRRGIWSGTFEMPEEVRHAEQTQSPRPLRDEPLDRTVSRSTDTGACRIKGNRSRRGEWIYHLPGMPYYDGTRAEQMFCTEADARAAGYRKSRAQ